MSKLVKLTEDQLSDILGTLPRWRLKDGRLHRELKFADFRECFAFMTKVAMIAERMEHHPDWFNSYDRLTLDLMTHAAGGITERDVAMARAIDHLTGGEQQSH